MQTRKIGALDVTVVGIGCNNFGRELDKAATRDVVHAALDHGVTFFDTADTYGNPRTASETLLGEILKPHRESIVLATKFGRIIDADRQGASLSYVRAATEASLKRLQTDRIDLMQLHIPDPATPVEDTLGALADLIREGKIREIGCSNVSAAELTYFDDVARKANLPRFVVVQNELSLLNAAPAAALLQSCAERKISFLPFRPLFNGLLSGKYRPGVPIPETSRIGNKTEQARAEILSPENLAAVAALTGFAEARGHSLLELAFGWLLASPLVPSVIAGVSSSRQVAANAAAASWIPDTSEMEEVAAILAAHGQQAI